MQGRMVDIEKLRAQNESVRAVGNMNVNARGDVLGAGNTIVSPKAEVIQKYYEQPRGKVDDTPSRARPTPVKKIAPEPRKTVQKMTPVQQKPVQQKVVTPKVESKPVETFKPKTSSTAKKGIDAALDGLE